MSNKAIIERTREALEARGFSKAEALQMIRRIQSGEDEVSEIEKAASDHNFKEFIRQAYDRGFADGKREAANVKPQTQAPFGYYNPAAYMDYLNRAAESAAQDAQYMAKLYEAQANWARSQAAQQQGAANG